MADVKISDLTVITSLPDGYYILVSDSVAGTKIISFANLKASFPEATGDMLSSQNLADVADAATSRDNLGLGTAAVADLGTGSDEAAYGNHAHSIVGGVGIAFEDIAKPSASGLYNSPPMPYAMTVPEDFAGSHFENDVDPTAEQEISIKLNGTEVGTITVSTSGVPTWATTAAEALEVADGDKFSFGFPASQDATWSGIAISIKGARTI